MIICADDYIQLRDAVQKDVNANNWGKCVILPSYFVGLVRYMNKKYEDAMMT